MNDLEDYAWVSPASVDGHQRQRDAVEHRQQLGLAGADLLVEQRDLVRVEFDWPGLYAPAT